MSKRKQASGEDSAEKRTKTEIIIPQTDIDMVVPTLTRQASVLIAQAHTNQPEVLLRPRIKVTNDKIEQVIISRLTRTPSPFKGNRMGDHTVAWQAVVDSVQARLHDLTIPEAIQALTQRQHAVSAWMIVPDSEGRKLLRQLDDAAERRPRLENAAYQVGRLLTSADTAGSAAEAVKSLQSAIAWHLTYVNYLPFATVPAKSARGSHGSSEGRHRAVILTEEKKGAPAPTVVAGSVDDKTRLQAALWGMFAFEAAMREARAELAVVPDIVTNTDTGNRDLTDLADACLAHAAIVLASDVKGRGKRADAWRAARLRGDLKPVLPVPALALDKIVVKATDYTARPEEYKEIKQLAAQIRDAASYFGGIGTPPYSGGVLNQAEDYQTKIGKSLTQAALLNADVTAQSRTAVNDAALVLAHLLHDHQSTVARAYPRAVIAAEFLQPAAMNAARDRLRTAIEAEYSTADGNLVDALMEKVEECYGHCGDTPSPATSNGWVARSATQELVVAYTEGTPPIQVNGRPRTPAGVAGMGSHSTAWVVECLAADALVSGARTAAEAITALRDAVRDDLGGEVIKLDRLLPADQLTAGQMEEVFDAALSVFQAKSVQDAVVGYLTFRNMLPYATVDAGDRGGHGEDVNASEQDTFDAVALRMAAELEGEAREDADRRQESSEALDEVADWLAEEGNPDWGKEPYVKEAVAACAVRLRAQANDQDANPPTQDEVASEIRRTRRAEHASVYSDSRKSSLAGHG